MKYEIILAPEAVADLRRLPANIRSAVKDGIERHFRHAPSRVSKSRIKRLEGISKPQFRLRIDDVRVFYDTEGNKVFVLAVIERRDAQRWLAELGESE